jgi:hypothetical protein
MPSKSFYKDSIISSRQELDSLIEAIEESEAQDAYVAYINIESKINRTRKLLKRRMEKQNITKK